MSLADVVKMTTYLVDEEDLDGMRKARSQQMGDHRPASTLVIARRLAQPGWRVEIEAIAAKA
jgi:enamine deaminase RidA (YjgF/YER057c/UK114 family)